MAIVLLVAAVIGGVSYLLDHRDEMGAPAASTPTATVSVRWVDGDSGTYDGKAFRLHGVDAPEGSPSRAKCATEQSLSASARAAAEALTASESVRVRQTFGKDDYGRDIVDLAVDGRDIASILVAQGHLQRWDFDGGAPKPDWCG